MQKFELNSPTNLSHINLIQQENIEGRESIYIDARVMGNRCSRL